MVNKFRVPVRFEEKISVFWQAVSTMALKFVTPPFIPGYATQNCHDREGRFENVSFLLAKKIITKL